MRRPVYPLALILLALALAGCGAGETVSNAVDPVAQAATNTARVSTTHMSMTASMTAPGLAAPFQMSGEGAVDNARKMGSMTLDMSSMASAMPATGGLNDPSLWRGEYVFDFSRGMAIYLRFPFMTKALGGGKSWVRMDVAALSRETGMNLDQLMQMNQSNPAQQLDMLRAVSGQFRKLGTARVRGVATTRYRASVDLRKYPKLFPKGQRDSMEKAIDTLAKMMGRSTYPVEVYVDKKQLVRRLALRMDMKLPTGQSSMAISMDFYGFGRPVSVTLPSPSETADLTELIGAAQAQ